MDAAFVRLTAVIGARIVIVTIGCQEVTACRRITAVIRTCIPIITGHRGIETSFRRIARRYAAGVIHSAFDGCGDTTLSGVANIHRTLVCIIARKRLRNAAKTPVHKLTAPPDLARSSLLAPTIFLACGTVLKQRIADTVSARVWAIRWACGVAFYAGATEVTTGGRTILGTVARGFIVATTSVATDITCRTITHTGVLSQPEAWRIPGSFTA